MSPFYDTPGPDMIIAVKDHIRERCVCYVYRKDI